MYLLTQTQVMSAGLIEREETKHNSLLLGRLSAFCCFSLLCHPQMESLQREGEQLPATTSSRHSQLCYISCLVLYCLHVSHKDNVISLMGLHVCYMLRSFLNIMSLIGHGNYGLFRLQQMHETHTLRSHTLKTFFFTFV